MDEGAFLCQKFQEVIHALETEVLAQCLGQSDPREQWVTWASPEGGWRVLNTDGAAKGNPGTARGGGVIRGDTGEWIIGFS